MRKARIKQPFSMVQWHGEDYPCYGSDAEVSMFKEGDEVLVLHEAEPNPMGRLFVVFNEGNKESAVVSESYISFIDEEQE